VGVFSRINRWFRRGTDGDGLEQIKRPLLLTKPDASWSCVLRAAQCLESGVPPPNPAQLSPAAASPAARAMPFAHHVTTSTSTTSAVRAACSSPLDRGNQEGCFLNLPSCPGILLPTFLPSISLCVPLPASFCPSPSLPLSLSRFPLSWCGNPAFALCPPVVRGSS